jgi:hypothetical protein
MSDEIKTLSVKVSDKIIVPFSGMRGIGDVVAAIANPIAQVTDAVFNTKITGCNSCKDRQNKLNKLIPFGGGDIEIKKQDSPTQ